MPALPRLIAPPDQIIPDGRDYDRPDKPNISVNRGEKGHKIDIAPDISAQLQTLDVGDADPTLTFEEMQNLVEQMTEPLTGGMDGANHSGSTPVFGRTYDIIDLTIKSNRYNMAGMIKANVIGDVYSDTGTQLNARIGLDGPSSEKLVASGRVWKSYPRASVGLEAKNNRAEVGTTVIGYDEIRWLNLAKLSHSFKNRRIGSIVKKVFKHAGVRGAIDISPEVNKRISVTYDYKSCGKILNDLARRVNGVWFVDARRLGNTILFTDELDVDVWNIGGIAKTSLGLQEQPYTQVVVIGGYQLGERGKGNTPTGKQGNQPDYMFEVGGDQSTPVPGTQDGTQETAQQGSQPDYMFEVEGENYTPALISQDPVRASVGKPGRTYKHYDQSIHFQKQARLVANKLLQEFKRQQRYGTITITGDPRIQPYDAIRVPPSLNGRRYIVSKVEHTINNNEGYRTKIHVSGTVNGGPITQLGTQSGGGSGSQSLGSGSDVTRGELTQPDTPRTP